MMLAELLPRVITHVQNGANQLLLNLPGPSGIRQHTEALGPIGGRWPEAGRNMRLPASRRRDIAGTCEKQFLVTLEESWE
jgi:hypothetical protein